VVLSLSLMLQLTVSRPVCLGIKHPSGAYDQISIAVRQLRVDWCGALSLTRGGVCHLLLPLVLASAVILGSESCGPRNHILLSQIPDSPFCRLLWLVGLQWRYWTHLHMGFLWFLCLSTLISFILTIKWTHGSTVLLLCCTELLPWIPYDWVIE
jgi:hypothetical protein